MNSSVIHYNDVIAMGQSAHRADKSVHKASIIADWLTLWV